MPETTALLSQFYVKLNGQDAPDEMTADLLDINVETSLHLPDVCTVTLHDPHLRWVDDARLAPGVPLQVTVRSGSGGSGGSDKPIFDGEIVELEPQFGPGTQRLSVRGFDRLHRLARGQHARSFLNVTDGDLIQRMAQEVGLQAKVGQTNQVYEYLFQNNESNLAFLQRRAAGLGYLLYVQAGTLHCEPPGSRGATVELEWGHSLREFYPRMTTVNQLDSVTVRGWDPANREQIVGTATKGQGGPQVGESKSGGELAHSAYNLDAQGLIADRLPANQAEAERLATAAVNRLAGSFVEAEGVAGGDPALVAGASAHISAVGDRFGGTYLITSASHTYSANGGYSTHFSVSGFEASTLLTLVGNGPTSAASPAGGADQARISGLVIGTVTDNNDPLGQGRVKVMFPWLTSDHSSEWARVVIVGGGPQRGIEYLPEIKDEVLVGFDHGDINHPYVLGGLWNGVDAPPMPSDQAISSGRVEKRIIRSRAGHTITLDDADGAGGVTVEDRNGNVIKLDSGANSLTITVQGNANITSSGDLTLQASGNLSIKADGEVDVKGMSVNVEGDTQVNIKGTPINLN